jgi:hypothetical protein
MLQRSLPEVAFHDPIETNCKTSKSLILEINDPKIPNNHNLTHQKWVLNKLLEMKFQNIEQTEEILTNKSMETLSKVDLMNVCLDVLSFHTDPEGEIEKKKTTDFHQENGLLLSNSLIYFQKFGLDSEAKIMNKGLSCIEQNNQSMIENEEEKQIPIELNIEFPKKSKQMYEEKMSQGEKNMAFSLVPLEESKNEPNFMEFSCTSCNKKSNEEPIFFPDKEKLCYDCFSLKVNIITQEKKICEICIDYYDEISMAKISEACPHEFCKSCANNYLIEYIKMGKVKEIKCPYLSCTNILKPDEIKNFLKNEEINKKYEIFLLKLELDSDPSIRWCINPICDQYLKGSAESPKLVCKCGEIMCFNCSSKWHDGKTCNEVIDLEYENYRLKMNIMNCPKCKSRIEKISGCNHMSCSRCYYEFCWICGEKYSRRHFKNYNIFGCPGLMYTNIKRSKSFVRIHRLKYAIKFFFSCLIFIVGIPLLAILGLLCLPNLFYINNNKHRRGSLRFNIETICILIFLGVLGIIISPFVLIFAILPGSCLLLKSVLRR